MKVKKRAEGKFLRLSEIHEKGEIYQFDEQDYFRIDEKIIRRVRVFGIVFNRFESEEKGKYVALSIDDGSDTIRLKLWSNPIKRNDGTTFDPFSIADKIVVGDTVDVIGRIRKWEDEFYIIPSDIKSHNEIDWEINRRAILLGMDIDKHGLLPKEESEEVIEHGNNESDPRSSMLEAFSDELRENTFEKLMLRSKLDKSLAKDMIAELQMEGRILNPEPGFYLLID